MKKIIFVMLMFAALVVGNFDDSQRAAKEYGLMKPEEYFSGREDFERKKKFGVEYNYINDHKDEYDIYVNVSIIEIAEEKAAKYHVKDYDGFVRQVRKEPDITAERVDAFRRSGHYIKEYEQYVKSNEWKKFIPKLW